MSDTITITITGTSRPKPGPWRTGPAWTWAIEYNGETVNGVGESTTAEAAAAAACAEYAAERERKNILRQRENARASHTNPEAA